MKWNEYFYYDETSPTGLRWNRDVFAGRTGKSRIVAKGDIAGCFTQNKNGTPKCVDVRADLVLYKAHRIIYEMMIGVIPDGFVVDHLDQNPWNNSLGNLCVKPKAMNHRNTKMIATNTTGITGVSWQTMNKGKHTYAVGRVTFEGKELSARFGVHHYGLLPAFKLAFLWRENKIKELNEKFDAGFTELHGVECKHTSTTCTTPNSPV